MIKENTVLVELRLGQAQAIIRAMAAYSQLLSDTTRDAREGGLPYLKIVEDTVKAEKYDAQTSKGTIETALRTVQSGRLPVFIEDLAVWVRTRYLASWDLYEIATTNEDRARYSLETLAYQTVWYHLVTLPGPMTEEEREALAERHEKLARSREQRGAQ